MQLETENLPKQELDPFDTWLNFDVADPINWLQDETGEYVGLDYPTPPFVPGEDDEF